jgi:rhamnosyltransferase
MFDETYGLRKTGTNVPVPSPRTIIKIMTRGIVRDTLNIMYDPGYTFPRKVYWLLMNPLFYIEKWRGVRKATKMPLENRNDMSKYSLEESRKKKRRQ